MKTAVELDAFLKELQLVWIRQQYESLAAEAAQHHWSHADYLQRLLEGECLRRRENRIQRRIQSARFPVVKTLDSFNWSWPKKINREQIQNLFRLAFLQEHGNVILLGGVGLGKTHLVPICINTLTYYSIAFADGC
jgi:DNA replication protein DnaC